MKDPCSCKALVMAAREIWGPATSKNFERYVFRDAFWSAIRYN